MGLSTLSVVGQELPLVVSTLFKHYLSRKKATKDSKARSELLFDEAFNVMKAFLEMSTKNTVEDLQRFGNTHIPSPWYVIVIKVLIPLSSCKEAAGILIEALGGPEHATKIVGGTKWWQVRGLTGVEGEWIAMRRDWDKDKEEVKAKQKQREKDAKAAGKEGQLDEEYDQDMDKMRCMLYIHGGAHYWGSINTHRYTIWRYARKMKGRAFAVNYRKSPQYPFPCALQDCIAAYLYLIRPPPGAKHRAVSPKNLIIAGDSAGGNLVLTLLQVIRDSGLPMPAGAVAISPWCDLTHCFPSVMENFAGDVMPPYGFIHKPSTLWPPPAPEVSDLLQSNLRNKVKEALATLNPSLSDKLNHSGTAMERTTARGDTEINGEEKLSKMLKQPDFTMSPWDSPEHAVGGSGSNNPKTTIRGDDKPPEGDPSEEKISLQPTADGSNEKPVATDAKKPQSAADPAEAHDLTLEVDGQLVTIRGQIQLYATNHQLAHPYVSPAWGYLGGLCPLLIIASDKELLRDEILYTAHKAAHPDRYPVLPHVKQFLPSLEGIEQRYGPTKVHVQCWDEMCHVIPLFSMTTPAKYCFRSIATFCKFVTGPQIAGADTPAVDLFDTPSEFPGTRANSPQPLSEEESGEGGVEGMPARSRVDTLQVSGLPLNSNHASMSGASYHSSTSSSNRRSEQQQNSVDVAGPRVGPKDNLDGPDTAGHPAVYAVGNGNPFIQDGMIRERVSIKGVVREMEPELEIQGLTMNADDLAKIRELPAKRYLTGQRLWDKKYHRAARTVEEHRVKNLEKAKKDGSKIIEQWQARIHQKRKESGEENVIMDEHWTFGWALAGENPPPSAVVSRRDTKAARALAKIVDSESDDKSGGILSGVNLWSNAADLLSSSNTTEKNDQPPNMSNSASPLARVEEMSGVRSSSALPESPTEENYVPAVSPKPAKGGISGFFGRKKSVKELKKKQSTSPLALEEAVASSS